MGALASGIFGLLSGDPTKTEENQLSALSGYETPTGEKNTTAASDYYTGILSGNPEEIAQTLAPEISAEQGQTQQAKDTMAQFGNRSGGTNSAANAADAQSRANIINLIGGAQQNAAAGAAGLGTNLLGQTSSNINSQAALARQQQEAQQADVGNIAQGAAEIASGFIDPAAAGGGADPFGSLYSTPMDTISQSGADLGLLQ